MSNRYLWMLLSVLVAAACSPVETPSADAVAPAQPAAGTQREPDEDDEVSTAEAGVQFVEVPEAFLTASTPDDNIDSPASWQNAAGDTWLLASAKGSHRIMVYDGDNGASLRSIGGKGSEAGELKRPNGVFVIDDLMLVVERDNRRVQVFGLPGFDSLGSFGEHELIQPYGLWARRVDAGYEVLVSDAYMSEQDEDRPPAVDRLGQRYKRYRMALAGGRVQAELAGHVGSTDAAGAIRIPESLWGDEQNGRLLLAEEDQQDGTRHKIYTLDFTYTGEDLGAGLFKAQAEGIALWQCADGSGYWLATDQFKDRSVFHVFDRQSLHYRGAFAGRTVANTDGVWLQQGPTRAFPQGVFYAVHDDQGVAAFDWRGIAAGLHLRESCAMAEPAAAME